MLIYLIMTAVVIGTSLLIKNHEKTDTLEQSGTVGKLYKSRESFLNCICLLIIFTALFLVSACRLNVGNDYAKYVEFMHLIYCKSYVPTEMGFNALTYLIYQYFGYENYLVVFAVIAFATILIFMAAMWQQSEKFTYTFIMFMLLGYYFQSISTVRYYLALAIALYSVKFVIRRDWPRFVLLILLGATFHKSILVVLVLYILAIITWKKWMYFAGGCLCLSFLLLQDMYLKLVVILYPSYEDTEYLTGGTSYINIARCAAILILSLVCYNSQIKNSRRGRFFFHCNILALVLYVFCSFLPIISRIGYFLTITHILFVPMLLCNIPDQKRWKKPVQILVLMACIAYFLLYMRGAANDGIRILPYQTFMFHDMPPILSEKGY